MAFANWKRLRGARFWGLGSIMRGKMVSGSSYHRSLLCRTRMRHRLGSESHTWVSTCLEFAQQRTPSICAILTRSATNFAPIFFIMRPRSTLTRHSWAAICLLLCPVETRAKTSRSREARVSKRACRFEQPSHGCIASDRVRLRSRRHPACLGPEKV